MSSQTLRSAFDHIKAGEKALARIELRALLDKEPENADAWWLMAHAASDPAEIRQALQQDLRLRPDHRAAQQKLEALNRKYPPPDESDEFERWLALENVAPPQADQDQPVRVAPTRKAPPKKNNQAWLLYGSIGLFVLLVCGGIFAIAREVTRFAGDVVNSEEFQMMQAAMNEASEYEGIPENAEREGVVAPGERKPEYVDSFVDDVWTFRGRRGQEVLIRLEARDEHLDPQLYLFHPDGYLIASNDDVYPGFDTNSEIYIILPDEGRYSILVSAFGVGGAYEMFLD